MFHRSAAQRVTLTNGDSTLTINGWDIGPDFQIVSTTCPAPRFRTPAQLAPEQSCTFQIIFQPQSAGTKNELFTVTDNATNNPQQVKLQGVGKQ